MQTKSFFFSVVMPIYNSASYLKEAIDSLILQTIGFQEFIQLILVDDGSTDNSLQICNYYKSQYPDNITVIPKSNGGVGSARNEGMKHAIGNYINFLDSDDKWGLDAFQKTYECILKNSEPKIITTPIMFFDRKSEEHSLNFRFKRKGPLNIFKDWDCPHFSFSCAFIKKELLDSIHFSNVKIGEDTLAFTELLLEVHEYSTVPNTYYYYRRRLDQSSATDLAKTNRTWWFDDLVDIHKRLFDLSVEKYGEVIPYVQYCVMCVFQDRFRMPNRGELSSSDQEEYRNLITSFLPSIDDEIILRQRRLSRPLKLFILSLKYKISFSEAQSYLQPDDEKVYWTYNDKQVLAWDLIFEKTIHIDFIEAEIGTYTVKGYLDTLLPINEIELFYKDDQGSSTRISLSPNYECGQNSYFQSEFFYRPGFSFSVPYKSIHIYTIIDGKQLDAKLVSGKYCPLDFSKRFGRRYYALLGNNVLTAPKQNYIKTISTNKLTKLWILKREVLLEVSMMKNSIDSKLLKLRRYVFIKTLLFPSKKKTWIISDRIMRAGDNGEALFQYLSSNSPSNVSVFFTLSSNSPDFKRLETYGKVIPYGSPQFKKIINSAELSISSVAEKSAIPRFSKDESIALRGLPAPRFIFLQHGVIVNNVSTYAKRRIKNISLMLTSSSKERKSIIDNPQYGLSAKQVYLTGLPRFDKLLNSKQPLVKKILIAPTYRKRLRHGIDFETGLRPSFAGFEQSNYFNFFNNLINNKKLINTAKELGYEISFLLHPCHEQEAYKFSSEYANIITNKNYSKEFLSSSIMVTDYSSVAFDYALLRKPLIYAQFDKTSFEKDHAFISSSYFDFETDGFGPICNDMDSLVNTIIRYMKSPKMENVYQDRVNTFFDFSSSHVCEDVTKLLTQLKE